MADSKVFSTAAGFELAEQEGKIWGDGFAAALKMAAGNAGHLFASQRDCVAALFKELANDAEHGAEFMAAALETIWANAQEDAAAASEDLNARGVEAAVRFLERHGYKIVDLGWAAPSGGIADIVANDPDGALTFVGVRTSRGTEMPAETVTPERRMEAERLAIEYLMTHDDVEDGVKVRFDDITITAFNGARAVLRHHVNCLGIASAAA